MLSAHLATAYPTPGDADSHYADPRDTARASNGPRSRPGPAKARPPAHRPDRARPGGSRPAGVGRAWLVQALDAPAVRTWMSLNGGDSAAPSVRVLAHRRIWLTSAGTEVTAERRRQLQDAFAIWDSQPDSRVRLEADSERPSKAPLRPARQGQRTERADRPPCRHSAGVGCRVDTDQDRSRVRSGQPRSHMLRAGWEKGAGFNWAISPATNPTTGSRRAPIAFQAAASHGTSPRRHCGAT